jgi:Protein of unknown function (DUF4238)
MHWRLYQLPSGYPFLTSDWPVELSLGAPVPMVSIPLGPRKLFVATDSVRRLEEIRRSDPFKLTRTVNEYVVKNGRRYVFSHDESQASFILKNMSAKRVKPPFFPNLADLTIS